MSIAYGTFNGKSRQLMDERTGLNATCTCPGDELNDSVHLSELIPRTSSSEICIVIKASSLVWGLVKGLELLLLISCEASLGVFVGQFDHEYQMRNLVGMDLIFVILSGLIVFTLLILCLTYSGVAKGFRLQNWLCMMMVSHVGALFVSFMCSVLLSRDVGFYHIRISNTSQTLCERAIQSSDNGSVCSYLDGVMVLSWIICCLLSFDVLTYCISFRKTLATYRRLSLD